jgi:hypothetical protein
LGACGSILVGLLLGLRWEIYWHVVVLTSRRFHGVLSEFFEGLNGVLLGFGPREGTPCQIKNHVQWKFATPILYAIYIFLNYDFFSLHT